MLIWHPMSHRDLFRLAERDFNRDRLFGIGSER